MTIGSMKGLCPQSTESPLYDPPRSPLRHSPWSMSRVIASEESVRTSAAYRRSRQRPRANSNPHMPSPPKSDPKQLKVAAPIIIARKNNRRSTPNRLWTFGVVRRSG